MAPSFTLTGTFISLFFGCAWATPFSLQSRAISQTVFDNLQFFEQFAAAAYCPSNDDVPTGGTKLTCSAGNCPLVEADNVTTVYEFENSLLTDVTGYIAVDQTKGYTVLAFRGSKSVRNFLADADFPVVPTDICDGCTADQGFYDSWLEARQGVLAALRTTAAKYPNSKVIVTGHSLGAAIADFAAAEIKKGGTPCDLYTYGSPRIAGPTLSNFITNQGMGSIYRVTHLDDPVPRLPPIALGFVHVSPEYYISSGNTVPPTPADITQYTGSINLQGNTGNNALKLTLTAHGFYFNEIGACGGSDFEFKA